MSEDKKTTEPKVAATAPSVKAEEAVAKNPRRREGVVVSDKMDQTVTVRVDRRIEHPKYKKRYMSSKKYMAHNPGNTYKQGDAVIIEECRPRSRNKRWLVVKAVPKNTESNKDKE